MKEQSKTVTNEHFALSGYVTFDLMLAALQRESLLHQHNLNSFRKAKQAHFNSNAPQVT